MLNRLDRVFSSGVLRVPFCHGRTGGAALTASPL